MLLEVKQSAVKQSATPAVSVGQASRVDDMLVSKDKDKEEDKDTAVAAEADNVKEDEASGTKEVKEKEEKEDKDDKENEGTEDTAAAEAELELSR